MLGSQILRLGIVDRDPCARAIEISTNLAADIGAGMWYYVTADQTVRVRGPFTLFRPLKSLPGQPKILGTQYRGVDVWRLEIMDRWADEAWCLVHPQVACRVTQYLEETHVG